MSDVGHLCLACGLCCDGTLFGLVRVDAAEAAHAARHRLSVITRDDGTARLVQPCSALEGTACRVYADRPRTCRHYVCDLARALEEGEVNLDEARSVVHETHLLRERLAAAVGPDDAPHLRRRLQQRAKDTHRPHAGAPLSDEALGLFDALEARLDHSFRGRRGR
jgi:Fe-S-cluster containining protein